MSVANPLAGVFQAIRVRLPYGEKITFRSRSPTRPAFRRATGDRLHHAAQAQAQEELEEAKEAQVIRGPVAVRDGSATSESGSGR